jgi:acetyl-CoA C-acetyltransferase
VIDRRQPVLVGVGQINHRDGDAPDPADMLTEAVRRAAADSGGRLLDAIGSVRVVSLLSRGYPDPGRLIAEGLRLADAHTVYTTQGGHTPQLLVDRACDDIAAGRFDVVAICGGECWRTRSRIKRRGESSPWADQARDVVPSELFGEPLRMASDDEARLGFTDPVQAYPMFEQALRARHQRSLAEQLRIASRLWARLSEIAAGNEYAAIRTPVSAEAIRTPGPDNRLVGFPYPKLMNSNSSVDQAAALLLCSAETAEGLGVPQDRWVFLHGAGEGNDVPYLSERHDLSTSPAIALAGQTALELAGIGVDDLAHIDLYSCFPSAVEVAAEALGLSLDRDLSVTGGLTFAGGPWNAYVLHSLATMATVLRGEPDAYGLVSANGGFLTKHAVGIWSARPPASGTRWQSVQKTLDATVPRRRAAPHHEGEATLETYTVMHDRAGKVERAWVFARTDEGHRTLAVSDDVELLDTLETEDVIDRTVDVADGVLLDVR